MTNRPTFMAITSTGGYIGRIYWHNSAIHRDFPRWGKIYTVSHFVGQRYMWAGLFPMISQIINWRFYDYD